MILGSVALRQKLKEDHGIELSENTLRQWHKRNIKIPGASQPARDWLYDPKKTIPWILERIGNTR